MLHSMKQMAKLYCVGSVSIRVRDCISLVLILWLFSHGTEFVPKSCQLPCFISHCSCFVCIFLLSTISWARNQAKNTVILAGQANFYSTVLCWISSEKWLLWQHQKFCCFHLCGKTWLFQFIFSHQFFSYIVVYEWTVSYLCCLSILILFLSTKNNPGCFQAASVKFLRKKKVKLLFFAVEGNQNYTSFNC